jgi:hypothetical protein
MLLAASVQVAFDMPFDGKATVALDGPDGRRVRNLVNGIEYKKGRHTVEWDGRAEDGSGAAGGKYTVRVVAHPGIGYDFRGTFAAGGEKMFSGFGPNHLPCTMLAPAGDLMVAAALFTEGGNSTLVLSHEGKLLNGYGDGWNLGNKACFYLAGTNDWLYSVRERDGNDLELHCYGLLRNARRHTEISGAPKTSLKGAARIGGKVYLSNALSRTVDVYALEDRPDRARLVFTGERIERPFAGPLCVDGDSLVYPMFDRQTAIAVKGGELFALEEGDSVVHVYERSSGRETRIIGERGNGYAGAWRKNRLVNPTALAFDSKGSLWIAESRYNPKRVSRWNAETGVCEYEKVGSEKYGSPGVGMDEEDATRWIAHDTEWRYDPEKGVDEPIALLFNETIPQGERYDVPPRSSRTYRFARRGGKTYVIGNDGVTMIWEYLDSEMRLKPLAMFGSPGFYSHMIGREHTCAPIGEAYAKAFPDKGGDRFKHDEATLMAWHDLNGNERFDADEFEFGPFDAGAPCGWGLFVSDLDFTVPIAQDGEICFLDFAFPEWSLSKALAAKRKMKGRLPTGAAVPGTHGELLHARRTLHISDAVSVHDGVPPRRHARLVHQESARERPRFSRRADAASGRAAGRALLPRVGPWRREGRVRGVRAQEQPRTHLFPDDGRNLPRRDILRLPRRRGKRRDVHRRRIVRRIVPVGPQGTPRNSHVRRRRIPLVRDHEPLEDSREPVRARVQRGGASRCAGGEPRRGCGEGRQGVASGAGREGSGRSRTLAVRRVARAHRRVPRRGQAQA